MESVWGLRVWSLEFESMEMVFGVWGLSGVAALTLKPKNLTPRVPGLGLRAQPSLFLFRGCGILGLVEANRLTASPSVLAAQCC